MTTGESARMLVTALLLFGLAPAPSVAATGCDLSSPDRDVYRLFPGATSYTTKYVSLRSEELAAVVTRLDARFRALYDPINVPYTLYEIYTGTKKVGYIHGVNQKGQFGGIQVFVSLDLDGRITAFYIQKITGPSVGLFRTPAFGRQFLGLSLGDFDAYDPVSGRGSGKIAAIRNPAPDSETDFYGILRALKKNLILMDVFVYSTIRKNP
jgi:hypothetical protein